MANDRGLTVPDYRDLLSDLIGRPQSRDSVPLRLLLSLKPLQIDALFRDLRGAQGLIVADIGVDRSIVDRAIVDHLSDIVDHDPHRIWGFRLLGDADLAQD